LNGTVFRKTCFWLFFKVWHFELTLEFLLLVWRLNIVAIVAGTGGWKLEGLDGEWEVLIIWIVDQESVVDVLLETLGLVAWRHKRTGVSSSGTFLDTSSLGQSLVVSLDSVDDNPPLSVGVDGSPGLDVGGDGGAEVGLLHDLLQPGHAVVGVGEDVLVDGLHSLVVVLQGVLDLVGRVFRILQAPSLWVADGTLWWSVRLWGVFWLMVGGGVGNWGGLMVRGGVVDGNWLVVGGGLMVGSSVDNWGGVVDHGNLVVGGGGGVDGLGCVDGGGVVDGLDWTVGGGGRVAVDSGVDSHGSSGYGGNMSGDTVVDCGVVGDSSFGVSLGIDCQSKCS